MYDFSWIEHRKAVTLRLIINWKIWERKGLYYFWPFAACRLLLSMQKMTWRSLSLRAKAQTMLFILLLLEFSWSLTQETGQSKLFFLQTRRKAGYLMQNLLRLTKSQDDLSCIRHTPLGYGYCLTQRLEICGMSIGLQKAMYCQKFLIQLRRQPMRLTGIDLWSGQCTSPNDSPSWFFHLTFSQCANTGSWIKVGSGRMSIKSLSWRAFLRFLILAEVPRSYLASTSRNEKFFSPFAIAWRKPISLTVRLSMILLNKRLSRLVHYNQISDLSRSAGFPPLSPSRTVHATFTAHGSCNSINYLSL